MKKVIFVSPPKTATRTVRACLNLSRLDFDHSLPGQIINVIGQEEWDESFKFSFVRNPFDRLVSWYEFSRTRHPNFYNKYKDFKEWAMNGFQTTWQLHDEIFPFLEDDIMKYGNYDTPYYQLKLSNYISDDLDYVGRVENIEEDMRKIGEMIGVEVKYVPHKNKSKRKEYKTYYDDELIAKVHEIFGDDLDKFGYEF